MFLKDVLVRLHGLCAHEAQHARCFRNNAICAAEPRRPRPLLSGADNPSRPSSVSKTFQNSIKLQLFKRFFCFLLRLFMIVIKIKEYITFCE